MAVFVSRTAPGDRIKARITQIRRHYAVGELVELLDPSPQRVFPPCPYYERCGGCQLQHMSYRDQLQAKTDQVIETLERIGAFHVPPVQDISPAESPFGYRNKAVYHCQVSEGRLLIGLVGINRDEVIDLNHCPLQSENSNRVSARIRSALERTANQTSLDQSILRHLVIRTSEVTGLAIAVLVVRRHSFPGKDYLIQELEKEKKEIDSLWLNVNSRLDHSVLGEEYEPIWGPPYLREQVGGLMFDISLAAFFQVNTQQTEKLIDIIRDYAALTGKETVLDLYGGVGLFSLALADRSQSVYDIEMIRPATLDAIHNAELNDITNCCFRTGKAERLMQKLFVQGLRPHIAILDPPRRGCHSKVLDFLPKMGIRRILYVSCSPPTLSRDLKALIERGYRLQEVQPLDMFPQTYHMECVALLTM